MKLDTQADPVYALGLGETSTWEIYQTAIWNCQINFIFTIGVDGECQSKP